MWRRTRLREARAFPAAADCLRSLTQAGRPTPREAYSPGMGFRNGAFPAAADCPEALRRPWRGPRWPANSRGYRAASGGTGLFLLQRTAPKLYAGREAHATGGLSSPGMGFRHGAFPAAADCLRSLTQAGRPTPREASVPPAWVQGTGLFLLQRTAPKLYAGREAHATGGLSSPGMGFRNGAFPAAADCPEAYAGREAHATGGLSSPGMGFRRGSFPAAADCAEALRRPGGPRHGRPCPRHGFQARVFSRCSGLPPKPYAGREAHATGGLSSPGMGFRHGAFPAAADCPEALRRPGGPRHGRPMPPAWASGRGR